MESAGPTQEDVFNYLEELRASGKTNMFLAPKFIQEEYGIDRMTARKFFVDWTNTYKEPAVEEDDFDA